MRKLYLSYLEPLKVVNQSLISGPFSDCFDNLYDTDNELTLKLSQALTLDEHGKTINDNDDDCDDDIHVVDNDYASIPTRVAS